MVFFLPLCCLYNHTVLPTPQALPVCYYMQESAQNVLMVFCCLLVRCWKCVAVVAALNTNKVLVVPCLNVMIRHNLDVNDEVCGELCMDSSDSKLFLF